MNNYDWKNAFPKPTENFHKKLCSALEGMEKESVKMKKISVKKCILIAAAAVMIIGTAAFASSKAVVTISGGSSSIPDYKTLPTQSEVKKETGFEPKLIESFSNGYTFSQGNNVNEKLTDEENGVLKKYTSLKLWYEKDGDKITLSSDTSEESHSYAEYDDTEVYNGIQIAYNSYTNKFVPPDYEKTAQDIADEENGDIVFSYGTDDVEIMQIQGAAWEQDGIYYNITAMDSPLDRDEIINMAKEIIDFQ